MRLEVWGYAPLCGDGKLTANEECDDGGTRDGDGCDSQCRNEYGGEPTWLTVANLDAADGCWGDTEQVTHSRDAAVKLCKRLPSGGFGRFVISHGANYTKVRGLITAYSSGAPSSFWRKPIHPMFGTTLDYRGDQSIDSTYVDGISVARLSDAQLRSPIFTLAVGFARSATVEFGNDGPNKALAGNCLCHGGIGQPPPWMSASLYYCDAATEKEWDTAWQITHLLFSEAQTCVKDQIGTAAYWKDAGLLPGQWLVGDLPQSTDPIEVRIMGSSYNMVADIGIARVKLEVFGFRSAMARTSAPSRPEKVTLVPPYLSETTQSPQQLFYPAPTLHVLDQRNLRSPNGAFDCWVDWAQSSKEQAKQEGWKLLGTLSRSVDGVVKFTGLQTVGVYDTKFELLFSCKIGYDCTDSAFALCTGLRVSSYVAKVKVRRCYAGEATLKDSMSELTANVKDARSCIPCDSTSAEAALGSTRYKEYCSSHAIYFAVAGGCDLGRSDTSSDTELQVCWYGFENANTSGTVLSYEIGIGTARGLTDRMAFRNVFLNTSVLITVADLIPEGGLPAGFGKLAAGTKYFATVRLTNSAGVQVVFSEDKGVTPQAGPFYASYSPHLDSIRLRVLSQQC